jgi:hypothetical protein
MNQETIDAIVKARDKYEGYALMEDLWDIQGLDLGPYNCALCLLFNMDGEKKRLPDSARCQNCPVALKVGTTQCDNTPFEAVVTAHDNLNNCSTFADDSLMDAWKDACNAEADFLNSLLPTPT